MKRSVRRPIAMLPGRDHSRGMSENGVPPSNASSSLPDVSIDAKDIRTRVKQLHEKARSVSETLDHVERTLEEAAGESCD